MNRWRGLAEAAKVLVDSGAWGRLSEAQAKTWLALARHANRAGIAWPSKPTLAREAGIDERSVRRAIVSLEADGLIEVSEPSAGGNRHATVRYQMVLPLTDGSPLPLTGESPLTHGSPGPTGPQPLTHGSATPDPRVRRIPNESPMNPQARAPAAGGESKSTNGSARRATSTSSATEANAARIYPHYPRKVGRQAAVRAIVAALRRIERGESSAAGRPPPADPVGWLIRRVQQFAASPAGRAGRYTPHPSTWFRQGRYDDEASEWQRGGEGDEQAEPDETPRTIPMERLH